MIDDDDNNNNNKNFMTALALK